MTYAPQPSNLPYTDTEDSIDLRVRSYFENYFDQTLAISPNDYDSARAFFYEQTKNEAATAALVAATLQTASQTNTPVYDVIESFRRSNDLATDISVFLNLSREGTSLLGFVRNLNPTPNTQRQIRV